MVDRFIKMKVAEKEERLTRFRKEVSQRVKKRETHKQALIGKHVRKVVSGYWLSIVSVSLLLASCLCSQARKEARMVCQAQSEVGKSLETRSGLLQTDVDDVCLVTKKISPKSNVSYKCTRDTCTYM